MKIRNGFVSNSSSSSFIIALEKVPENADEIHQILFGNIKYISIYDNKIDTKTMAKVIFKDITESGFATDEDIAEEMNGGHSDRFPQFPDLYKIPNEEREEVYKKYCEKCEKIAHEMAEEFISNHEGMSFFIVEYSDNDGPLYSTMEHGNIFSRIPHVRISKH
jgi:hypothetical protein